MPTEHEFKYVISLDMAKEYDEETLRKMSFEVQHIKQGYLAFSKGMTLRIRCLTKSDKKRWYLTLKTKIGDRVIEIENKISGRDGKDLWTACVGQLGKIRYVIQHHDHTWEVDFFRKAGVLYFVQAEVELEEGADRPETMPEFLKKHVLYEVPLTDDRFSNKKLGDVEYAYRLYQHLLEKRSEELQDCSDTSCG